MKSTKRFGFTLVELMVVVAMLGIIVAVTTPRVIRVRERSDLRAARDEIATALAMARSAAVQKGITANFILRNDSVQVRLSNDQVILPVRALFELYDAKVEMTLDGAAKATDTLTFDSRGFGMRTSTGATKYTVRIGSITSDVCVSRLGLVTKVGCVSQ